MKRPQMDLISELSTLSDTNLILTAVLGMMLKGYHGKLNYQKAKWVNL